MKIITFLSVLLIGILIACDPNIGKEDTDDVVVPPNQGTLEFRFIMPVYKIPKDKIHRVSLSFAWSVDSLYRGQFFKKVNVSDLQEVYTVYLPGDEYYYHAVITCSCAGDTCLNGDFPGGRYGMKYNFDKFSITVQQTTVIETRFQ